MGAVFVVASPWRDLASRLWRQAYQVAGPILVAAAVSGVVDPRGLVLALASAEAVTAVKFVVVELKGWHAEVGAPMWRHLLDRALPAVGGVLAGVPVATLADVVHADWAAAGWASLLAAVIAVLDYHANPTAIVVPADAVPDASGSA